MGVKEKKKQHITAFYMEMLVLIMIFVAVILILTRVFALSRQQSAKAEILTDSVCLAENLAEMATASDSREAFSALLERGGDIQILDNGAGRIFRVRYDEDRKRAKQGVYRVDVEWKPEESPGGSLVKSVITVYWGEETEPVYTLETGVFHTSGQEAEHEAYSD